MAEDERLREALLELQLLQEREAQALRETKDLLACIEAFSMAATPQDRLDSIFASLRDRAKADHAMLLDAAGAGSARVVAADRAAWVGAELHPPLDLTARARNLADLALVGDWGGDICLDGYAGMLVAPFRGAGGDCFVLLCLRAAPHRFAKEALNLAERLAGLAVRALQAKTLAAENALLAATIQGSSSGVAISDAQAPDKPLVYVNPAFERLTGYLAEELLGTNCRILNAEPPDAPERTRLRRTVAENGSGRFLLRNRRKSGQIFWNELTLFPVRDTAGTVSHLVATQNDVSERIAAEEDRYRTRARMEQSLAATDNAFLVLDPAGRVVFANAATSDLFPAAGPDWCPDTGFAENWNAYLRAARTMPGRVTRLLETPDLDALAALPSGREVDLPDGRSLLMRAARLGDGAIVVSATDVTPLKSAQMLLEQRLAAIEAARDGIAITDHDGRLFYLNGAAAALLGFAKPPDALGRKWMGRYVDVPEVRVAGEAELTLHRDQNGKTCTHEITASRLDGNGFVIVIRDVTERLETEAREEDLKLALIRAQRQEAVAQLASGIAHDFNNLLSAINGSATLITMDPTRHDAVRSHAERIASAGTRAARLVNRLLDLGAPAPARGTFELRSVLSDLEALVAPTLPSQVGLEVDITPQPLLMRGDSSELHQAVVNLVFNARDAIGREAGHIRVQVDAFQPEEPMLLLSGLLPETDRYARIRVGDTGKGMTEDVLLHAMEPYFTTKGREGTGLGLAIVGMQLGAIGGGLDIASTPGTGTTVTIYWPCQPEARMADAAPAPGACHDLSGMTILVIDDEPEVADVLQSYLETFGAEVAVCDMPQDGVEAVAEGPQDWSAVITDYDMPGMTGGDVVERLSKLAPEVPVFLVTALARRLSDPRVGPGRVRGVFAKPVDLDKLCGALSALRSRD
ncbi:PAS domain-containing hybrid sensor histidine kinase/response regulator [Rhodovulum adriaticum]|uniref:histidine kinase n=1 Tax=Rhodovulum adriaticum TaxID=35804 RepID=A0A4R2P0N3_RHOAD|nr:PAS domain S-box protein [Rhodovulum adriaticum]MBK1634808.1 hypothetical protein [Rhodovulum adriaticum]TCP27618.1 PAS domain S-box-containing protein [Rhodovulum adriaticum]